MSTGPLRALDNVRNGQAIRQRLGWLEDRLYWLGELNRADLVTRFGISPQQASNDIKLYTDLAPENMRYNLRRKCYEKATGFHPLFENDGEAWLAAQSSEPAELRSIAFESVLPIKRRLAPAPLRAVVRACRHQQPLSVLYQSLKSRDPSWRTICPHSIVKTDVRWHLRAWVDEKQQFSDVIPNRILQIKEAVQIAWVGQDYDSAWNATRQIVLVPSISLSRSQREVIELDYQMTSGSLVIRTRECLVYYQLAAMHLLDAVRENEGEPLERNFGLAVANWSELAPLTKTGHA